MFIVIHDENNGTGLKVIKPNYTLDLQLGLLVC